MPWPSLVRVSEEEVSEGEVREEEVSEDEVREEKEEEEGRREAPWELAAALRRWRDCARKRRLYTT